MLRPRSVILGLSMVLAALALFVPASTPVQAKKDDARPIRYSFPSPIPGTDFGRKALEKALSGKEGDELVEELFKSFPLSAWVGVLRNSIRNPELNAMDAEIEEVQLTTLIRGSQSAQAVATALNTARVSDNQLLRALRKALKDSEFRGTETAAYLAEGHTRGLNEAWMTARLNGRIDPRDALESLDRWREKDRTEPRKIWDDVTARAAFIDAWQLYAGLPGRPVRAEIEAIAQDNNVTMTPEVWRALSFGDPLTAVAALEGLGLRDTMFSEGVRDLLKKAEKSGNPGALGDALLASLSAKEEAQMDWFLTRDIGLTTIVKGIYSGNLKKSGTTPALDAFTREGKPQEDWKRQPDRGISDALAAWFTGVADFRLALYSNNSVRAMLGTQRYEGLYDAKAKSLKLSPVYGAQSSYEFTDVELHGEGLLMSFSQADTSERKRRGLLRRTAAW